MIDKDLAELYGVETRALIQAVKRNMERFPEEFMFQLSEKELQHLQFSRSQFVILKQGKNIKYLPYAFTEQGVAMLSSVLNSNRAIMVNIQIMRTFVHLRRIGLTYAELKRKITTMENKYDGRFKIVFDAIRKLVESSIEHKKGKIGFHTD